MKKEGAPAPAAPKKPAGTETSANAAWKEMMNRFRRSDPAIWSMLTQGELTDSDNGRFIWKPSQPGGNMFLIPLNKPEKRQKICDCLSEITGMTCEFSAADAGKAAASEKSSEKEYLNQLYERFGAEKVIIQE